MQQVVFSTILRSVLQLPNSLFRNQPDLLPLLAWLRLPGPPSSLQKATW